MCAFYDARFLFFLYILFRKRLVRNVYIDQEDRVVIAYSHSIYESRTNGR